MTRSLLTYNGKDLELRNLIIRLQQIVNGGLDFDNLNKQEISGTTSSSPNTSKLFTARFTSKPFIVLPKTGNIYIHAITNDGIDVRSTVADTDFTIVAMAGS